MSIGQWNHKCVKCGDETNQVPTYVENVTIAGHSAGERLSRTCRTCGYMSYEPCKDAPREKPKLPEVIHKKREEFAG